MISGGSDVCEDEDESDVVPPCPMLWLDEVRNTGEAVEYMASPRHHWASQTSQSAFNKLNSSVTAREQSCDGSAGAADSLNKFNETGNHVVEDNEIGKVYELITPVETAEETLFQAAQLNSGLTADKLDLNELIGDRLDSNELIDDILCSDELIVDKLGSDELIVDKLGSDELIVDKLGSDELIVYTLDTDELLVDKLGSDEFIADKLGSDELIADKLVSDELIADTQDSSELIVDKLDSNDDDRPACVNVESIDDIRSDLSELMHLELTKDTNDGDRETTQNIVGVDHLSQEVTSAAQKPEGQDLSVHLSVPKTDTCRKSSTNLHVEMDIVADAVSVHMQIDEQDRCPLKPDQHLALDLRYSKSLGDLVHQHRIQDKDVVYSDSGKPVLEISEEGMLFDSKVPSEQVGLSNVKLKVHVQEPPSEGQSTVCYEKKLMTYSGLVNPGFKPEDDDDEAIYMAKQLINNYPVEAWNQEPPEAYNYDSGLPEIRIDDGYSDLGDTNDDIRDFRSGDDAVEEIDPLVNVEAEGAERTGCEVNTNEDMRPVCENMAAFDHLSSEVTGEKRVESPSRSNTQVDCGLHVSDINLHFSVSNNSLKFDFALKSPDIACLSEDRRLENLQIAECSSCVIKTEERNQTSVSLKADYPSEFKAGSDQADFYESISDATQHLYSDELYVNTNRVESQEGNVGSMKPTISATGVTSESLHYIFSPQETDRHNNANEGLENGSPPAVFESHECTSCQNFMLSNRQGNLSSTVDELGPMNCCPRNKKTVTRSTHLDFPGMALLTDIHVQKTLIAPSCSELGEISAAICPYDMLSASGSHGIATNENVDGASFPSAHGDEWGDMAACAVKCFDTVFWVCLVLVIILFEIYKCYWLFLLPSCLFILSVLVSDNPKPSE